MTISLSNLLDEYIDQEKLYQTEGQRGLEVLCKISRALGYRDEMHFGQIKYNVTIGDFLEFLKDNPGCVEAILEWIGRQEIQEWCDNLESNLEKHEEDDEDE